MDDQVIEQFTSYAYLFQEVMFADGHAEPIEHKWSREALEEWADSGGVDRKHIEVAWDRAIELRRQQPRPRYLVDRMIDRVNRSAPMPYRIALVGDLANIVVADQRLRMEEVRFVNEVAQRLGINPVFDEDEASRNVLRILEDGPLEPHSIRFGS